MKSKITLFFAFFLLFCPRLFATHIRAADFSAERITATTYQITLNIYTDYETVYRTDNKDGIPVIPIVGLVVVEDGESSLVTDGSLAIDIGTPTVTEIVANETLEHTFCLLYTSDAADD